MRHRLSVRMRVRHYDGRRVAMPVLNVAVTRGNVVAPPCEAIVDTGSAWTLARAPIAERLGISRAELLASPHTASYTGVDGKEARAHGVRVRLTLGLGLVDRFGLDDVPVFFTDAPLAGYDMLLGQHGVLEHMTLAQVTHVPRPYFLLQVP